MRWFTLLTVVILSMNFAYSSAGPVMGSTGATGATGVSAPAGVTGVTAPIGMHSQVAPTSAASFFDQVITTIQKFGGASTVLKISLVVLLLISSMKVSFVNQLFWSKLGTAQTLVAPLLGLVAGLLDIAGAGGHITIGSVMAYVSAGSGAIILHELLDAIKGIPGLGSGYLSFITMLEKALGGPASDSGFAKKA